MKRVLLLRSARDSSESEAGLRLLHELSNNSGYEDNLVVVLMQDAVILALKDLSEPKIPHISEGYVIQDHLSRRGFTASSLRAPFKRESYGEIVKLVMNDDCQVVGSF